MGDGEVSKDQKKALEKVMAALARRDHSKKELRDKLKNKFKEEDIAWALQYAEDHNWLIEGGELSQKVYERLGRKGKGVRYINQYLSQKELPPVKGDEDEELAKAIRSLEKKTKGFRGEVPYSLKQKLKAYLSQQGFETEIIFEALASYFQ